MSQVRESRAQSVTTEALITLTAGAAVLAVSAIGSLLRALPGARNADAQANRGEAGLPSSIMSAEGVAARRGALVQETVENLSPTQTVQMQAVLTLAAVPYVVRVADVQMSVGRLAAATTPETARRAADALVEAVESSHRGLFLEALTGAWARAATTAGFPLVQATSHKPGVVHMVAEDVAGRALVAELSDTAGEPTIETEIVGAMDGECVEILDAFDRALEEEGVRTVPRRRKPTSGVAETDLAREFLRRRVVPRSQHAVSITPPKAAPRSRTRGQASRNTEIHS